MFPDDVPWDAADPISRRVHAVHMGAELHYPNTTVAHEDTIPGRNWQLEFPQDIRNCEVCHADGETSGTWKTKPNRLACSGCHDSDAAQAHVTLNTWDPTPYNPYSGDELESCEVCHGENGEAAITEFHGQEWWLSNGEFVACPAPGSRPERCEKEFVAVEILTATVTAGIPSLTFTVTDANGDSVPLATLDRAGFAINQLAPASGGVASNEWVPYIYQVSGGVTEASRERYPLTTGYPIGTLTYDDVAETYSYTFATDISAVSGVTYDASLTHRVAIFMGGHAGPTGSGTLDFVPDGVTTGDTRNIVPNEACLNCHGEYEFHGHGGDRRTIEDCTMCHVPKGVDSGESIDLKVLIHKIHAGAELASTPGPDGIVWDDPATAVDESADNGTYEWGNWAEFPAVVENCTKCHYGSGADVDNWKDVMSRDACGSCHDDIDWDIGTNHTGGAVTDDNGCTTCHGTAVAMSVEEGHDWVAHDPRLTPEFDVTLTISDPANGEYFAAGEAPLVTIQLEKGGVPIDHTTVVQDADGAEGCTEAEAEADACPAPDGKFRNAYLFVTGPRATRNPVLTRAARAEVVSTSAGPFDLSAADAALELAVDNGQSVFTFDDNNGDTMLPGDISVDVADGTFASLSAATVTEMMTWLNADEAFSARAIAYQDGGRLAIRSRNLGKAFSVQLKACAVNTAAFGDDEEIHFMESGSSYPRNVFYKHEDATEDDPAITWTTDKITYQLDPVDDLQPGTYVASVEIADSGRVSASDFVTPTVGWVSFQVGTATVEKPVASSCSSCHQDNSGNGFVLDASRHNKKFGDDAIDQCAACHNYQAAR